MTVPPKNDVKLKHLRVSDAELETLYLKHDFPAKLSKCEKKILCDEKYPPEDTKHTSLTESKLGVKYIDPVTGDSIAVIFTYTFIDGLAKQNIQMLRVNDTIYDATLRR